MQLQISRNNIYQHSPPFPNSGIYQSKIESAEIIEKNELNLPILANANDLREVVKFFKHKPHGVSAIELMNAEPRRVFDARKIAAYEFWGVLERTEDRLQLTALGEELSKNTEAECEIHRKILRSVPAYLKAVEWIYLQKSEIATFHDVADFWEMSDNNFRLSEEMEDNIEAVIVSFFSICHAAELGTATIGKRGQPARLNVRFDQIKAFLRSPTEVFIEKDSSPIENFHFNQIHGENIGRIYISAGDHQTEIESLRTALELADFESVSFGTEKSENGFLSRPRLDAMKQCQAAIFLLDENDFAVKNGQSLLHCARVTEISVAQALFDTRVVVLWNSQQKAPDILGQVGLNFFTGEHLDWETNVRLVKCLKNLRSN